MSEIQKKLAGTYRSTRGKDKLSIQTLEEVKPPKELNSKTKRLWKALLPTMISLKLTPYDVPSLTLAFSALENLNDIRDRKKTIPIDDLKSFRQLCELEIKYSFLWKNLMKDFFVSPKERTKFLLQIQEAEKNNYKLKKEEANAQWKNI